MSIISTFKPNNVPEYGIAGAAGAGGALAMVKVIGPSVGRHQLDKALKAKHSVERTNAFAAQGRNLELHKVFGAAKDMEIKAARVDQLVLQGANPSKLRIGGSVLIGAVLGATLVAGAINGVQKLG